MHQDYSNDIKKLKSLIENSKNTVFFGGAGVSTESGIPDFRSTSGLYSAMQVYGYPPEDLLSYTFFTIKPELFFKYYRECLISIDAKPNDAHFALAKMEQNGKLQALITQNIDGLHQSSGSKNVLELHGSNLRQYCVLCGEKYSIEYILRQEIIPKCEKCEGTVRPDVVLYEESLANAIVQTSIDALSSAELLIVGGTSLVVYPAAGLLQYFKGKSLVLINKTETSLDNYSELVIHDSIGKVLKAAVA